MNSIARSATLVALMGFQHKVLEPKGNVDDYSVLTAVFRDLYHVLRSTDIPLSLPAAQALEHCRHAQDELLQILQSMGLLTLENPGDGLFTRFARFVRRFTRKQSLECAEAKYRNSVFLLRDITMDAVTHYHLQHMRYELDQLCGGWDHSRIDITISQSATAPRMDRVKGDNLMDQERFGSAKGDRTKADDFWFNGIVRVSKAVGQSADKAQGTTRVIPLRGLFDTGSDGNFVSASFLEKNGIHGPDVVRSLCRKETVIGAEKTMKIKIEQEADLTWSMDGTDFRNDTFFVVDNGEDSCDILLGREFISDNEILAVKGLKAKVPVIRVRKMGFSRKKMKEEVDELQEQADQLGERPEDRDHRRYLDTRDMQKSPSTMSSTATTTVNGTPSLFGTPSLGTSSPNSGLGISHPLLPFRRGTRNESPSQSAAATFPSPQPTPSI